MTPYWIGFTSGISIGFLVCLFIWGYYTIFKRDKRTEQKTLKLKKADAFLNNIFRGK